MRAPVQIPSTPTPHSVLNEGSFLCLHNEIVSSDVILQVRIRHANLKTCSCQYNQLDAALTGSQTSAVSAVLFSSKHDAAAAAAAKSLSRVRLSATPWTAACRAPPPMGFSRQEYWSGVPLPSP